MLKNPVFLFVPEKYCLFASPCRTVDAFKCCLKSGICLTAESNALLFHRYRDQCEREHHPYYLVHFTFIKEEAEQLIDFAVSDTVRVTLKY